MAAIRGFSQATSTQPGTTNSNGQMTMVARAGTNQAAMSAMPQAPAAIAAAAALPRMIRPATVGARSVAVIGAGSYGSPGVGTALDQAG